MKKKSSTDNYNPFMGQGKNSTDNAKDGPVDGKIKKTDSKLKKAKEKKNIGVIGGYKFLTRKRNIQ